jgi:hypothetical protein
VIFLPRTLPMGNIGTERAGAMHSAGGNFREFYLERLSGNSYARAKRLTMSRLIAFVDESLPGGT